MTENERGGMTCEQCTAFSQDWQDKDRGECRRYAPRVVVILSGKHTTFPSVQKDSWCEEWANATSQT